MRRRKDLPTSPPLGAADVFDQPDGKQTILVSRETARAFGLGDVIKKATDALGIKQCEGCKRRQETLNKINLDAVFAMVDRLRGKKGAPS
jgi:hypothetical protein